jgi:hypothetical protein
MGLINDKKDGKDGKDDAAKVKGLYAMRFPHALPKLAIPRVFVTAVVVPKKQWSPEDQEQTTAYWARAQSFGLVDAVHRAADGTTTLVLAVRDVAEAKALLENDPMIKAGIYAVKSVKQGS